MRSPPANVCRLGTSKLSRLRRAASASCGGKCKKAKTQAAQALTAHSSRGVRVILRGGGSAQAMTRGNWLAVLSTCALAACGQAPLKPSPNHITATEAPPQGSIPEPVQVTPVLPKPKATARPETYSVVVNNVRAQELLFALARDARLQIDIDPNLGGTGTLNAIDQKLPQLLNRIARQIDMRYELDGDTLIVMRDSPFLRSYKIDYLSASRNVKMQSTASTQFGGSGGTTTSGPGTTGATSVIDVAAQNNLWESIVQNLKDILRETDRVIPTSTPVIAAAPAAAPAGGAAPGAQPPAWRPPATRAPLHVTTP